MEALTSMAANGVPSTSDFHCTAYTNSSSSLGANIVNSTTAGLVDYSVCELWGQVNEILLGNSSTSGSGSNSTTSTTPTNGASGVVINSFSWIVAGVVFFSFCLLLAH